MENKAMRSSARLFRGSILLAAFLMGVGFEAALAQELQLDPKALDSSGASSVQVKRKGKKGADAAAQQPAQGGKAGAAASGPNRQFGELEGWSPGKAPPKPKDSKDPDPSPSQGNAVNVTPSGNMSVGLPF
jgi:hypothetical protein